MATSQPAFAAQSLEHQFLTFPPFWTESENKAFSGLHYRVAEALYKHAEMDVQMKNVPYARMQLQVKEGKVAFINYGETAGVKTEDILHICVPPTRITLRAYYINQNLPPVKAEQDFENKRVILVRGLPLGGVEPLKQNKNVKIYNAGTTESALKMLLSNRGDYLVTFDNTIEFMKKNKFKENAESIKDHTLFTLLGYPVVTPKTYPNGEELCNKVMDSYNQLVAEGVINDEYKLLSSDLKYLDDLTQLP